MPEPQNTARTLREHCKNTSTAAWHAMALVVVLNVVCADAQVVNIKRKLQDLLGEVAQLPPDPRIGMSDYMQKTIRLAERHIQVRHL